MRRGYFVSGVVLLLAVGIAVTLSRLTSSEQGHPAFNKVLVNLTDPKAAVERFAGTLRFKTVSDRAADNHAKEQHEFRGLHDYLRQQWPVVFSKLHVETVLQFHLLQATI